MKRFEHVLYNGRRLKAVKWRLDIGTNLMYTARDKQGNVTTNVDKIVNVAEEFYRDLYSCRGIQDDKGRGGSAGQISHSSSNDRGSKESLGSNRKG